MTETRSLHRKLAQVMFEADRIPKNGTAPREMGGYKFVEVGDAADHIRRALAEKVVTMMPTSIEVLGEVEHATKSGGTMTTYTVRMEWTITDGESGETLVIPSIGVGSDTGDKFASKATTSAMKYALLSGFLLSTGDDSERSNLPERQPHSGVVDGWPSDRNPVARPELERRAEALVGKVSAGRPPVDLQLRQTPDGMAWGFKLTAGKVGYQALAIGPLADALATAATDIAGQTVSVWGRIEMIAWQKDGKDMPPYARIAIERVQTPDWTLPATIAPEAAGATESGDEEPEAVMAQPMTEEASAAIVDVGGCGWSLQPKSGPLVPCTLGEMHPGEHSFTDQAIKSGGRVVPPAD